MITLSNYQTTLTPFTLLEQTTLTGTTYYILDLFGKQKDDTTLILLTGDTSTNTDRYNYFPVDLTPYNLIEGQYNYRVWQSPTPTLSITGLTSCDIVENGFCYIKSSGNTTNDVYINPQTKYVFN